MCREKEQNEGRSYNPVAYMNMPDRECANCISGWGRNDNKVKCTDPDSPYHKKTINDYNVCDNHEFA